MVYYNEYSNNKSSNNYSDKPNYVKKITQIVLSVSIFSLFFAQSSLLIDSYDYLVSNFNFKLKLFTYTTERNCIFLLCNGILVLIIQSSGLISKITPAESGLKGTAMVDDVTAERSQENEKNGTVGKSENVLEEKIREVEQEEEYYQSSAIETSPEEEEEEEEEEAEDEGEIDSDELHKKCEDFIKKMKQEIQSA